MGNITGPLKQTAKFSFIGISSISRPLKYTVKFLFGKGSIPGLLSRV
jgi:hypothetical protein